MIKDKIRELENLTSYLKDEEKKIIIKAINFSNIAHKDQTRQSGDAYITHPIEVAKILTSINLDASAIAAGLLHVTIEDTIISIKEITETFGNQISELVQGLIAATEMLEEGGILIIVSFHSLEDKIVKYFFNLYSNLKRNPSRYLFLKNNKSILFKSTLKKPLIPTRKEIIYNIRSRSAKLRFGIRNNNSFYPLEDFKKKFNKYFRLNEIKV